MADLEIINFHENLAGQIRDSWKNKIENALIRQQFGDTSVVREFLIKEFFKPNNDTIIANLKLNRNNPKEGFRNYIIKAKAKLFDPATKRMANKNILIELIVNIYPENPMLNLCSDVYLGKAEIK